MFKIIVNVVEYCNVVHQILILCVISHHSTMFFVLYSLCRILQKNVVRLLSWVCMHSDHDFLIVLHTTTFTHWLLEIQSLILDTKRIQIWLIEIISTVDISFERVSEKPRIYFFDRLFGRLPMVQLNLVSIC